jgi:hypothetical protein
MFTPAVQAVQAQKGSRAAYARMAASGPADDTLGEEEAAFLRRRDSFYMASVGEGGWPYVQHRGGPPGFVRVLGPHMLGFADFRGNRQYISVGNLVTEDRVALFFMDYPNQARLKILGRARIVDDPEIREQVSLPTYPAPVERVLVVTVEAFDWNCPQHITPRYTLAEIERSTAPLRQRVAELEAKLARR